MVVVLVVVMSDATTLQSGWYKGSDGIIRSGICLPPAGFEYDRYKKLHKVTTSGKLYHPEEMIYDSEGSKIPAPPSEYYYGAPVKLVPETVTTTPTFVIVIPDLPPCIVCTDRQSSHLIYPCGHTVLCEQCSLIIHPKRCPMCRELVIEFVKVYA